MTVLLYLNLKPVISNADQTRRAGSSQLEGIIIQFMISVSPSGGNTNSTIQQVPDVQNSVCLDSSRTKFLHGNEIHLQ
jgi:hypothetical protein